MAKLAAAKAAWAVEVRVARVEGATVVLMDTEVVAMAVVAAPRAEAVVLAAWVLCGSKS